MARSQPTLTRTGTQLDLGLIDLSAPPTPQPPTRLAPDPEKGVVYTRPWVVDLILDLVGYSATADLATMRAVEPSAGEGAFLVPMARRLVASVNAHGRELEEALDALCAHELDPRAGRSLRARLARTMEGEGVDREVARRLAKTWVKVGDYLLDAPSEPRANIVVGNPPYIRYDDLAADQLAAYRALYPTMVGRADVYVGFIEAAIRSLVPGGSMAFICADRWMRSAYGSELRRLVSDACSVDAVIDLHNAPAFESDVSAYPAIVVMRRARQGRVLVATGGASAGSAPASGTLANAIRRDARGKSSAAPGFRASRMDSWFHGNGPWPSLEPERLKLLRHLEDRFAPLEDSRTGTKVGIGVATGADRVFVTADDSVVEAERLLPLAMSADTRTGQVVWSGHYLINPWTESGTLVDLDRFPLLRGYFAAHSAILRRRNISARHPNDWFRTIDKVSPTLRGRPKLYFPDMKMESHPSLDLGHTYPHHNLYHLTSQGWDLEVLGGLLLSKIAQLFIEAYCVRMRGGTLRFQAQYLRRIRVPDPTALSRDTNRALAVAFRDRDARAATAAAAAAYGLDRAEPFTC